MHLPTLKTWTRGEYDQMVDLGVLESDEHYELVDGQIVVRIKPAPQRAYVLSSILHLLPSIEAGDRHARLRAPVALSDTSEPEPDISIVKGHWDDYAREHPNARQVDLIVEVSDARRVGDLRVKLPLYAAAGIHELWLIDIDARKLEMHREPAAAGYRVVTILAETETASPLFRPASVIRISDLLPTASA